MPTRVLVVEDSATQAEALRALLVGAGYEVALAASGEEGLAQFDKREFDVVISDIVMPGAVDGYELCRRIKSGKRRRTPVVLLTSLSDALDIIHGLECGADNFFTKTVVPRTLLDRLKLLLATRETRAETKLRMGVKVFFLDREFTITSEREQILDLLISTFEDAVLQNRELRQREQELEAAKAELARYAGTLEQRLQTVLDNVPDVVFSVSAALTEVYYISPACTHVLGFTPQEFAADPSRWREAIHPEDRPRVIAFRERIAQAGQMGTIEYRIQHPDGSVRRIEGTLIPVADATGTVVRLDGVAHDITEQRKLEEQLRLAQKMEAVGLLAGGIAHDFNNLLTVILGECDMLLEDLSPKDPQQGPLAEIRKAGERAAGLTRQLLTFSRRQLIEPTVFNPNDLVTDVEKMLRRLIGEDINLITRTAPDLGTVKVDRGQLEQVLVNLAVNARDAMPQGGALSIETANVTLSQDYASSHADVVPGHYVMLAVSDTGTGMTEEVKQRLFEPFFTTKERGKGTGLGLATSYGIAKQFGGHIGVYSELGVGSTLKVYLPRAHAELTQTSVSAHAPTGGSETILLVEDEAAVRGMALRMLKAKGYTVIQAGDGEEALRALGSHSGPVHLLLTDVVLPKLGGRLLAQRVRGLHPHIRVLFASGYTDDMILQRQLLERDVALLQKPFTAESLTRKVREVLDGSA